MDVVLPFGYGREDSVVPRVRRARPGLHVAQDSALPSRSATPSATLRR
jgi:hypothetical protein